METTLPFVKSHAFIIGINDYEHLPPLKTAVNDAKGIAERLEVQHGYEIHGPLLNATKEELHTLFTETIPQTIGPDDRIVFYFAGHGIAIDGEEGPNGYIVPADAVQRDEASLIPMDMLHKALLDAPCKHGLLILDCCFSGAFKWSTGYRDVVFDLPKVIYEERFWRYVKDPAWQVITSSAHDQKAVDVISNQSIGMREEGEMMHSPFALALFEGIDGAGDVIPADQGDGVITASELYAYLRDYVEGLVSQSPSMFNLSKHDKGEFIFLNPRHRLNLPPTPDRNPFMGLASYNEADSNFFFGRDRVIEALLKKVQKNPLTVVSGASGTGKSSVIKAGLLPILRKKGWELLPVIRPGKEPMQVLAKELPDLERLLSIETSTGTSSENKLFDIQKQLDALIADSSIPQTPENLDKNFLLIIDQYEELISQCLKEEDRTAFENQLAAWLNKFSNLRIILSIRSDFEPQFESEALFPWWKKGRYIVPSFSQQEIQEVITKPALQAILFYEPLELIDKLKEEISQAPGALPLLSFTLSELYHAYLKSGRQDRALNLEDYQKMGGVIGALRTKADKIYLDQDDLHQNSMRKLMLRMVSLEGGELAGKRVSVDELQFSVPEETHRIKAVADQLVDARLVVRNKDLQGRIYVEPAHDALVRAWARLWEWIKTVGEEKLILQNKLSQAVEEYHELTIHDSGKAKQLLWNDNPSLDLWGTKKVAEIHGLNAQEEKFISKSITRRKYKRNLRYFLSIAAVIASVTAAFIFNQQKKEAIQIARESKANELAAEARQVSETDPAYALNLAYAAYRTNPSEKPTSALADIWNLKSRAYLQSFKHNGWMRTVAFSSDGTLVATGANDDWAKLWDAKTGKLIKSFKHFNPVTAIKISKDGRYLFTGSMAGGIILWDIESGERLQTLSGVRTDIYDIAFSSDEEHIKSINRNGIVIHWDLKTGEEFKRINLFEDKGGRFAVGAATFSADASKILIASMGKPVELWDLENDSLLKSFRGHTAEVTAVAFSNDGQQILTGSKDKTVKLWSVESRQELQEIPLHSEIIFDLSFNPKGSHILLAVDEEARLLDLSLTPEIRGYGSGKEEIASVEFSPDGKSILAGLRWSGAEIWDTETGSSIQKFEAKSETNAAVFFSDTKKVLTGSEDGFLRLWDIEIDTPLQEFQHEEEDEVIAIAISPDGRYAISGADTKDKNNLLKLWDLELDTIKSCIYRFKGHDDGISALTFSSDGQYFLSGSFDSTVILWEHKTKKPLHRFKGHKAEIYALAFSPDGTKIATTAGDDDPTKIWDLATGELLLTFTGHSKSVRSVKFSPDGTKVLTGSDDGTAKLWDAATGRVIRNFEGHDAKINCIAFSPDGKKVLTGSKLSNSSKHNLKLWDASFEWDPRIYKFSEAERIKFKIDTDY